MNEAPAVPVIGQQGDAEHFSNDGVMTREGVSGSSVLGTVVSAILMNETVDVSCSSLMFLCKPHASQGSQSRTACHEDLLIPLVRSGGKLRSFVDLSCESTSVQHTDDVPLKARQTSVPSIATIATSLVPFPRDSDPFAIPLCCNAEHRIKPFSRINPMLRESCTACTRGYRNIGVCRNVMHHILPTPRC